MFDRVLFALRLHVSERCERFQVLHTAEELHGEYVAKFGLIDWILTGEWDPSPEVCSEAWDAFDRSNWDRSHGTADAVVDNVTVGIVGSVGGATFDPENRAGAKKTAGTIIVVAEAATGAAVVGKVVAKTGVKGGKKVVKEVVEEAEEIAEGAVRKKGAKGTTIHGVNQKINRGVRSADELDALKNPIKKGPVKIDSQGRKSQRIVGEKAEVVINPDTGKIISVNPTSSKKAAKLKRQQGGQ